MYKLLNQRRHQLHPSDDQDDDSLDNSSNTQGLRRKSSRVRYKKFFDDYCTNSDFTDDG